MVLKDGHRLTLDDEEKATVFDIEGIRTATPDIVEYVPKSLSYSCMHMALSDINPPARADGLPAPLLAHEIGKVAFGISRRATRLVSLALKLLRSRLFVVPWPVTSSCCTAHRGRERQAPLLF
eukprot:s3785_g9.t1